nr:TRAP transporter large permease subunit [uncultured Cohaesibacter sp.]
MTTGVILFLVAVSSLMSWIMAYAQIPQMIGQMLLELTNNRIVSAADHQHLAAHPWHLHGCNACDPDLHSDPAADLHPTCFGMDPIHFGVMMIFNLGIGNITPPVGCVLFVGAGSG